MKEPISAYSVPPDTVTTITILDTKGEGFLISKSFADTAGNLLDIQSERARRCKTIKEANDEARKMAELFTNKDRNCHAVIENKRAAF